MDIGILGKIQFVSEKGNLSNNKVGSLSTGHLVFVGFAFRFIGCAETKPDLVANIELFSTVFGIVVSLGERIGFVYSYLRVFSQILSYKLSLQHVLRKL